MSSIVKVRLQIVSKGADVIAGALNRNFKSINTISHFIVSNKLRRRRCIEEWKVQVHHCNVHAGTTIGLRVYTQSNC